MRLQSSQPRFFNNLDYSENVVTKSSADIDKLRAEYNFSKLAPDAIKHYLVLPYNFKVENGRASYSMERITSSDLSITFTSGEMSIDEFQSALDLAFEYLEARPVKTVPKAKFQSVHDKLYLKKVDRRISDLNKTSAGKQIDALIKAGTRFSSLKEVVNFYKELLSVHVYKRQDDVTLSASHGDLCFSNMFLVDKELKLIDPKGVRIKSDLYLDAYYDVAKLSHSILGLYDYFNVSKYTISLKDNLCFSLDFSSLPNPAFAELFKSKLRDADYDYALVRLYEASLFLSMLPLHIDAPRKAFAFILNAINILEGVTRVV
jgi:hypothetical protein